MSLANTLKKEFPWLGTADDSDVPYPSGADAIDALEGLYRRLREETPPATLERGRLICKCGAKEMPGLREHGYSIKHHLRSLTKKDGITARGGGSEEFSDEGTHYVLECQSCYAEYEMPDGLEIDWV